MSQIILLGAGLTNLSLAYFLEQNGFYDYVLFEKENEPGGLLRSYKEKGFTFDYTGHFLHISNDIFKKFLEDTVGLHNCNRLNRQSFIYFDGRYVPYPFQRNLANLPLKVAIECFKGFLNRNDDIENPKNFYEWVEKYFGLGFGKHFFYPYNSKLLNQDPKDITSSWTQRFVPDTDLDEIITGVLLKRRHSPVGYNASFFYPKQGGIYSLIQSIVKKLKNKIILNHEFTKIDIKEKFLHFSNGNKYRFSKLFSTIPLPDLLSSLNIQHKLTYNSVFNFNLGFDVPNLSKRHWIYFPSKDYLFYRMGFWSNFGENMAPPGTTSAYGEVSFPHTLSESILKQKGQKAVKQTLDFFRLKESNLLVRKDLFIKYGFVTYDHWREKNLSKILNYLENNYLFSIGRFGAWKYSSMQEAVLDGYQEALKIIKRPKFNKHFNSKTNRSSVRGDC